MAGALLPFDIPLDARHKVPSNVRMIPGYVNTRVIAANTAENIAVPTGAKWAIFTADCFFYARPSIGGVVAAVVPVADVTDGSSNEANPAGWYVNGNTDNISVISATAGVVSISFYS